jgi:xanthine dehydrogenase YagS FAD-binding subunit
MRPFMFERAETSAVAISYVDQNAEAGTAQYLAGGTTLLDLMKLDVMRPKTVIDINALQKSALGEIRAEPGGLRLGALVHMSEAAEHADIKQNYPVIAQALQLAASQQIRNMASLGGNVLQRTRCSYFRDVSYAQCNKRNPGSGCAALDGYNRMHAVLGTSEQCIATYPGDFAQALMVLDAGVEVQGPRGIRSFPFAALHQPPENKPNVETRLTEGEMITGFSIDAQPWLRRSLYLKIRDRQSYEFALASAAVALNMDGNTIREARIALGGVATVPWRAKEAEAQLAGKTLDETTLKAAADAAFSSAKTHEHNAFKIELGKRTLIRAVQQAAAMEI